MKNDCHNNKITAKRRRFTSDVVKKAVEYGIDGFRSSALHEGDEVTTVLLRKMPVGAPELVRNWTKHWVNSDSLERGFKRAFDPADTDLDRDTRTRIAHASWSNDAGFLSYEDCGKLVILTMCGPRSSRKEAVA